MNSWSDVSDKKRMELLKMRLLGMSAETLADEVGMKPSTLARRLREMAAELRGKNELVKDPGINFKDWSKGPVMESDYSVITGDLQMPFLDYELANRMLDTADRLLPEGKASLFIAGDMMNMDVFSKYPAMHASTPSFETEIKYTKLFIKDAKKVFGNRIFVLIGNHERRLIFRMLGHFSSKHLAGIIGENDVSFYDHSWAVLLSGGQEWRITHQKNYSINVQTVGVKLAHKFHQNIMTHHQHRMSMGYDTSGKFVVVDNGCLADPNFLDYANMVDSTSPAMNQGFSVVRKGAVTLCAKDGVFTDWELLL